MIQRFYITIIIFCNGTGFSMRMDNFQEQRTFLIGSYTHFNNPIS
jgi:hypothetical protein